MKNYYKLSIVFAVLIISLSSLKAQINTISVSNVEGTTTDSVVINKNTSGQYEIDNIDKLRALSKAIRENTNKHFTDTTFILTQDISFSSSVIFDLDANGTNESNFIPIGGWQNATTKNSDYYFGGTFEGNNKTISGLIIKEQKSPEHYSGLFGRMHGATIRNLHIESATLSGAYVGSICGYVTNTTSKNSLIENCYCTNSNITSFNYVGGICGYALNNTQINNCYCSSTNITATNNYIGGICGQLISSLINNCHYLSSTIQGFNYVGGICGSTSNSSSIINSYSEDLTITATNINAGGICGNLIIASNINKCYCVSSNIKVTDFSYAGGICGLSNNSTINNSYCVLNQNIVAKDSVGGLCGDNAQDATINNCYCIATIKRISNSSKKTFGGLVGNNSGTITNSYSYSEWNQTSGLTAPTGSNGTSTKTSDEMQNLSFITTLNNGFYNFKVGDNTNSNYPILTTENESIAAGKIPYNIIIPSTYSASIPNSITIADGASFVDNRATSNISSVTIKKNMIVDKWNLFGLAQTSQTNAATILNNNTGNNQTTTPHDMAAVDYDYNNNSWNTTNYMNNFSTFTIGKGYFVYPYIGQQGTTNTTTSLNDYSVIVSQTGSPQTDDIPLSLSCSGSNNNGYWFALSNPFMGRLDISKFLTANTGINTIITGKTVYTYNAISGWDGKNTGEIYPAQGFMVAKSSSGSLSINIHANQQIGKVGNKESNANEIKPLSNMITFIVQANGIEKKVYANINERAKNGFDDNDAFALFSNNNENIIDPYFEVENKNIFKNEFKSLPYQVTINFHSSKVSEVRLSAHNIPNDVNVSIIDITTNEERDLRDNDFCFVANIGENGNRFIVSFSKNEVGINNIEDKIYISLYPNPAKDYTLLQIGNAQSPIKIIIKDVSGREIKEYKLLKVEKTIKIDTREMKSGLYIISIIGNNIIAEKELIKIL